MSDPILLTLSTVAGALFVGANVLTGSEWVQGAAIAVGFPLGVLVTGIAWYTALRGARNTSITKVFAFLSSMAVSAGAFFTAYATGFWLVLPIVGVLLGWGTVKGLSRVRAFAVVPLVIALVVGLVLR